jgi:tetratricopeptide (TPR) repeat protein
MLTWNFKPFPQLTLDELYDLLADPGELHNLLQNQQAIAHEIRGRLEKLVTRLESNPQPGSSTGAPADLDILKSLGYVATSTPLRVTSQHDLPDPKDKLGEFMRISTAAQLTAQAKCAQALPSLIRLAREDSSLFIARSLIGQCHFAAGDYASARIAYAEAARLRPYSVEAVFYVAACDLHLGHPDAALAELNRTLELQPDYPFARYYLGLVYQQQHKLDRAIEELQKSVTVDPDLEEAQAKLGFLLAQSGKYSEAATHFRKVVELDPENAEGHFNLGLAYAKAGKTAAAQTELETACRLNPAMCRQQNPQ